MKIVHRIIKHPIFKRFFLI